MKKKHLLAAIQAVFTVGVLVAVVMTAANVPQTTMALARVDADFSTKNGELPSDMRIAQRLQQRIKNRFGFMLATGDLLDGIRQQRTILGTTVTVNFATDSDVTIEPWLASTDRFPRWIRVNVTRSGMQTFIEKNEITTHFLGQLPSGIRLPEDATLLKTWTENGVRKAETTGVAKSGYDFDAEAIATAVKQALENGTETVPVSLKTVHGKIINATDDDIGPLELLASGKSDFAGSGFGRKANVRKGLAKYLNNTLVPHGEQFGINSVLSNAPISEWEMALGIFDGGDLRPVAGGGLCQVATTLYRAALNTGLPITKRANHSLYVTYYEKFGVGIDATIFPGKQDMKFMNNTAGMLLIQAYTEGDEAMVSIYGTPDGRTVAFEGPYFSVNAPAHITVNDRAVRGNEIVWKHTVMHADGRIEDNLIVSRYKAVPKRVVKAYTETAHAAAPETDAN